MRKNIYINELYKVSFEEKLMHEMHFRHYFVTIFTVNDTFEEKILFEM